MELDILSSLSWYVHPPTPHSFAVHFASLAGVTMALPIRKAILGLAKNLAELCVTDYFFVTKRASSVGLASLLFAMNYLEATSSMKQVRNRLVLFQDVLHDEVDECIQRIEVIARGSALHESPLRRSTPTRATVEPEERDVVDKLLEVGSPTSVCSKVSRESLLYADTLASM
jgi:hypothetical protein